MGLALGIGLVASGQHVCQPDVEVLETQSDARWMKFSKDRCKALPSAWDSHLHKGRRRKEQRAPAFPRAGEATFSVSGQSCDKVDPCRFRNARDQESFGKG